ncbi:MAG: hypothetical protein ACP5GJ_02685 [Nanopusillaceae archaeon]
MVKSIKDAILNYYRSVTDPKTPKRYIEGVAKFLGTTPDKVANSRAVRNYILFTYKARVDGQRYIEKLKEAFKE